MKVFISGSRHLEHLDPIEITPTDPVLVEEVNKALEKLPDRLREIVKDWIYQGMTTRQLACTYGISNRQAGADLYEAKRQLRALLADFVYARWKIRPGGVCRLCTHPKSILIEQMFREKAGTESWPAFGKRVSAFLGENNIPPRLLTAHLNHINNRRLKYE